MPFFFALITKVKIQEASAEILRNGDNHPLVNQNINVSKRLKTRS